MIFGEQEDSTAMSRKGGPHTCHPWLTCCTVNSPRAGVRLQQKPVVISVKPTLGTGFLQKTGSWLGWSFWWINDQLTPQWPVQEEQGKLSNAGPFLWSGEFGICWERLTQCRLWGKTWGASVWPWGCLEAKSCCSQVLHKSAVSVCSSSCVTPSSISYGTGVHSQGKCLVLRGRLAIFYCHALRGMSVPLFIHPVAVLERHKKPWPHWLVLPPPEGMEFRGMSVFIVWFLCVFLWNVLSLALEGEDLIRDPFSLCCSSDCLGCIYLVLQNLWIAWQCC